MTYLELQPRERDIRLRRAIDMLESSGVRPFPVESIGKIYTDTQGELLHWNYRDALLSPVLATDTLIPKTRVACVEIGGTKLRINGYEADTTSSVKLISGKLSHPIIFHNKEFSNVQTFIDKIIDDGEPQFAQLKGIHALAIVFSFDADTVIKPYGVDMHTTQARLSKGFRIRGIGKENIFIGNEFIKGLKQKKYNVVSGHTTIVTNDVADILSSVPSAKISLVLGTGLNIGIALPNSEGAMHIYNSESANLKSFPLSGPEQYVQRNSLTPDNHHAEFIAGGESIGQSLETILQMLHLANIFPYEVNMPLSAAALSAILNNDKSVIKQNIPDFDLLDHVSWNILREIANRQFQRAIVVVALSLAAMIANNAGMFPEPQIDIPYTGSTFKLVPNFRQKVTKIMETLLPQHNIRFIEVPGSKGAAFLALREYAKQYR